MSLERLRACDSKECKAESKRAMSTCTKEAGVYRYALVSSDASLFLPLPDDLGFPPKKRNAADESSKFYFSQRLFSLQTRRYLTAAEQRGVEGPVIRQSLVVTGHSNDGLTSRARKGLERAVPGPASWVPSRPSSSLRSRGDSLPQ